MLGETTNLGWVYPETPAIPGTSAIATWGGRLKEKRILPRPTTHHRLAAAVWAPNITPRWGSAHYMWLGGPALAFRVAICPIRASCMITHSPKCCLLKGSDGNRFSRTCRLTWISTWSQIDSRNNGYLHASLFQTLRLDKTRGDRRGLLCLHFPLDRDLFPRS